MPNPSLYPERLDKRKLEHLVSKSMIFRPPRAMGATQRARLTVSDFDFQIKGQTALLYSIETHFGGGGQHFGNMSKSAGPEDV